MKYAINGASASVHGLFAYAAATMNAPLWFALFAALCIGNGALVWAEFARKEEP